MLYYVVFTSEVSRGILSGDLHIGGGWGGSPEFVGRLCVIFKENYHRATQALGEAAESEGWARRVLEMVREPSDATGRRRGKESNALLLQAVRASWARNGKGSEPFPGRSVEACWGT